VRVLLTGAQGFVGSNVLIALSKAGHEIVAIKRSISNLPTLIKDLKGVIWINSDQNFYSTLESLGKFDVVVHLATNYGGKNKNWIDIELDNVVFPLKILQFSINNGCNIFINTDTFFSRSEYSYAHMEEYISTKKYFSSWGFLATTRNPEFIFINARLEHVYGPGDSKEKFTMWLLENLISNKKELKLTTCQQERDFIYIDDVVEAYLSILNNATSLKGYFDIGIGTGISVPLKDFILTAKYITGSSTKLHFGALPQRKGEIMSSQADSKILNSFGWTSKINMVNGLESIVKNIIL
jgi:nucleoside-diphosphate-sugar epimerase